MIPLAILIFGLLLVLVVSSALLIASGMTPLLTWVIPCIPMLAMFSSALLIILELFLFLGSRQDRKAAYRDLKLLVPTFALSALLWYGSAFAVGLWR